MNKKTFIAEVKTISPFGFKSDYSEKVLLNLALAHGDMISLHTDPLWGWSDNFATQAAMAKNLGIKVLAKGIHEKDEEIEWALNHGADYVLVVGRIPHYSLIKYCYLEPLNDKQYEKMADVMPPAIVINSRSLEDNGYIKWRINTGVPSKEAITMWNTYCIQKYLNVPLIQASNIQLPKDVKDWADGYIVGQYLPAFIINKRVQKLYGADKQKV